MEKSTYTTNDLEDACLNNNKQKIIEILNQKILPTKQCFLNLVKYYDNRNKKKYEWIEYYDTMLQYVEIEKRQNFKQIYDENKKISKSLVGKEIKETSFYLLLQFGYKIDQEDFEKILNLQIYIENYKTYGLILDDKIQHICNKNLLFHYDEIKLLDIGLEQILKCDFTIKEFRNLLKDEKFIEANIKPMDLLYILCEHGTSGMIDEIMKKYNLNPDQECMDLLCKPNRYWGYLHVTIEEFYNKYNLNIPDHHLINIRKISVRSPACKNIASILREREKNKKEEAKKENKIKQNKTK
jgi:hypothetical protein